MAGTDQSCSKLGDHDHAAFILTEMLYLKRQQKSPDEDAAKSPCLARQVLPTTTSPQIIDGAYIKLYSYYVIDHSKLPSTAPEQLYSIRVVLVYEKSKNRVEVRFPSMCSLRAHFTGRDCRKPGTKAMPSLDEKYVMELDVAEEILYRRILDHEICENKNSWSFWVVCSDLEVVPKMGLCWSALKGGAGMLKWGKIKKRKDVRGENEGQEERENSDEEEYVKSDQLSREAFKKNRKRKFLVNANFEKPKRDKKRSKERYKFAELNMLKILKEKGAVFGRPIMGPALRTEARNLIGDAGLLDNLLKNMEGMVAPGGQERFRRWYNADGAMEYWLESADLVNIRKEAGVQDPYWTPPPGWSPGDNPTQDPVCARELKQLKEEIAKMSRDMQDLLSRKQEDDMAIVTTPTSGITSQTFEHDSFLLPLKEIYMDLVNKKAKIEEQLMKISHSLSGMEMKITKPNNNHKVGASIKCLPKDLLIDIVARVASGSVVDLFNIELSCKYLFEVGNDDYVLQHACMDSFPLASWPVSDKASLFLKRCKESGNAEALFRQAMFEYFTLSKVESALELLKSAAKKEHVEATYVWGIIILLCFSGENERRQALKLLTCLNKSRRQFRVIECRKRVSRMVSRLWVRNNNNRNITRTCNCWSTQSNRGWEEEDYGDTCSESCFWNREAALFSNLTRTNIY